MTSKVGVALVIAVLALVLEVEPAAGHREESRPIAAPPVMDFTPPAAGSYRLPPIQAAPDGNVLDENGRLHRLAEYTRGRVTLLALVYASCADPTGCPLAYATAVALQERILADHELHGRVRFVSLSFDPANDTPAAMRGYAGRNRRASGALPWHFLTTRSAKDLGIILDGFGQEIEQDNPGPERQQPLINHMLKLFLLDRAGWVREIYSTAFLHPEAMLNDIRTLVMEEPAEAQR